MGGTSMSLRVTVVDEQAGDTDTATVPDGEYLLIVTDPCYLAHTAVYPTKGTVVLTIKGRTAK